MASAISEPGQLGTRMVRSRRHGGEGAQLDIHGGAGLRAFGGRADRPAPLPPP
jgi:hypothetical protein